MKSKNAPYPWRDSHGKVLPDNELKKISATWSIEYWEKFLSDTVDSGVSEQQISTSWYDDVAEDTQESAFETRLPQGPSQLDPEIIKQIHLIKSSLKKNDRKLIHLIYWKSESQSVVAKIFKISRRSVRARETRILSIFKRLLGNYTPDSPLVKGQISSARKGKEFTDENVQEVYMSEAKRSETHFAYRSKTIG